MYARTKSSERCTVFDQANNSLKDFNVDRDCQIIIGGAGNIHFDSNLDNLGGRIESKLSFKIIKGTMIAIDL